MDAVKRILGNEFRHIHLEPAKGGSADNREYCSKDGDFEEFGECPRQGRRNDLALIKAAIETGVAEEDIARDHFSQWVVYRRSFAAYRELMHKPVVRMELSVYALLGEPGVGKTRFAYEYAKEHGEALYRIPDPDLKWFDGYCGQGVVLLDDFRGCPSFGFLLQLLDVYPLKVPVKGSFVWWEPHTIFITSNDRVEEWFPEKDCAPLLRRIKRTLHMEGEHHLPWLERYGTMKMKLNME